MLFPEAMAAQQNEEQERLHSQNNQQRQIMSQATDRHQHVLETLTSTLAAAVAEASSKLIDQRRQQQQLLYSAAKPLANAATASHAHFDNPAHANHAEQLRQATNTAQQQPSLLSTLVTPHLSAPGAQMVPRSDATAPVRAQTKQGVADPGLVRSVLKDPAAQAASRSAFATADTDSSPTCDGEEAEAVSGALSPADSHAHWDVSVRNTTKPFPTSANFNAVATDGLNPLSAKPSQHEALAPVQWQTWTATSGVQRQYTGSVPPEQFTKRMKRRIRRESHNQAQAVRQERAALRAFAGVPDREYVIDTDPPWKQRKKRKAEQRAIYLAVQNAGKAKVCYPAEW